MKIGISLPVRELADDLGAIKEFAQIADELGYTHLRVPDQVLRPNGGHLHEPMMLLAYVAAVTKQIELVPSVIVAPSRQTVLLAKQAAVYEENCSSLDVILHTMNQIQRKWLYLEPIFASDDIMRQMPENLQNAPISP